MDRFSYIVPLSPTSTVDVDSYYPTSNWQNGQWQYQDQSYLLHNPALRLPFERRRWRRKRGSVWNADGLRVANNPIVAPLPLPIPSSPKPCTPRPSCLDANPPCSVANPAGGWCKDEDVTSNTKAGDGSNLGWYVAGGLLLIGIAGVTGYALYKNKSKLKTI